MDEAPAGKVDTSKQAFRESVRSGNRTKQQRQVYDAIRDAGNRGRTLDELCVILNLQTQSVSPRCNELMRSGLVKRSGLKRATRTGRPAHVLVVTADHSWRAESDR